MKKTALIMAGGRGERFWPKSRKNMPKQFLPLTDDEKTMIQLTIERIRPLVELKDIFISTNSEYKSLVLDQVPGIPEDNILCEPVRRNTAPGIGLGAVHIQKKYEDALMFVLPSDHLIKYNKMYLKTLTEAGEIAQEKDNLVTIGITPDYPETGYGYIKFNPDITKGNAFKAEKFVEKPNVEMAKEYLETDEYLWNSGMFVWKVSTILNKIKRYMPNTYDGLIKIQEVIGTDQYDVVLESVFPRFESESIDYGIMEKTDSIYIFPGNFGWYDVGSWRAVERIKRSNEDGNIVDGNIITIDSKNCIIQGNKKLVATVGIKDLIIVDTEDATLICDKESVGSIKKVLDNLKICNRDDYI